MLVIFPWFHLSSALKGYCLSDHLSDGNFNSRASHQTLLCGGMRVSLNINKERRKARQGKERKTKIKIKIDSQTD